MVRDYNPGNYRKRKTRLTRIEEKKSIRQAVFFGFLTVVLLLAIIFAGIPALIKLAVFIGNIESSSEPVESTDKLAPQPPVLETLPEATSSGVIKIKGYAEAGVKVMVILNGEPISTLADSNGEFEIGRVNLKLGENRLKAVAEDQAGNTSDFSAVYKIVYDNEAPELEISGPSDGDSFYYDDDLVKVVGLSEPEARVYVNERYTQVDSEGNFSLEVKLNEGENVIKVAAIDEAGNKSEKEVKVNYSP